VNGLVKDRLLDRVANQADRRKISLSLTKKGRLTLAKTKKVRRAVLTKLLTCLNDAEIRQLHAIQEKMIAHLNRV
jgi:DNA-binding MarR family transcriptional regulator